MDIGKKGNIINHLPTIFLIEKEVNDCRIKHFNHIAEKEGDVLYVTERELRVADNFALNFAVSKAEKLNRKLKIVHPYKKIENLGKKKFYDDELEIFIKDTEKNNLSLKIYYGKNFIERIVKKKPGIVIIDFDPLRDAQLYKNLDCKIYEVDSHNIVPARYISQKQEYSAFQMRRLIYNLIYPFLTEFPDNFKSNSKAYEVLEDFIENKLENYAEKKNIPDFDVTSGLSKYINFGFISSQRIALEILKSSVSNENKETFLEELIVRKELSDNFCLYNKNYKNLKGAPNWANKSLQAHKNDFRYIFYTRDELEFAKTRDIIWNASQNELRETGKIHGYIRMYWAKKLLEWLETPEEAIDTAIYLNDKYAYDAPSPNGYAGILWSIAGLHDRPFKDHSITGKIRTMSYQNLKNKIGDDYLNKYNNNLPNRKSL